MAAVDVEYYIYNTSFSQYGVWVSDSSGFFSLPESKDVLSADWDGYNGSVLDLDNKKYGKRTIELSCFLEAGGYNDFVTKANTFLSVIGNTGTCTVRQDIRVGNVTYSNTMSNLVHPDGSEVKKEWDAVKMVGTFVLRFEQIVPTCVARSVSYPAPVTVSDGDVHYSLDGVDLKDCSVEVVSSSGLFCKPKTKDVLSVDWGNEDGIDRDNSAVRYSDREITLECYIYGSSYAEYKNNVDMLLGLISGAGSHRLRVNTGVVRSLVYEVYHPSQMNIKTDWSGGCFVGSFTMRLVEPEPVKRVVRASGTCSIQIASANIANIYWGDGSKTLNVSGDGHQQTVTHTYTGNGTYEIIVACETTGISQFSTNGMVIWNRLV